MQHVTVYREKGRYAGWPANYGIWSWGWEIVVGFTTGYHRGAGGFHTIDRTRPLTTMQARSRDGGLTWEVGPMPCRTPGNRPLSADEHQSPGLYVAEALEGENAPTDCPGGIHFTHPDFALLCARSGLGGGARSWFYISYDRCHTWQGPYWLPMFGQTGIAARTDYQIAGPSECTLFLTAAKPNGHEGRPFCARTTDGGKTFHFLSWIGPEPEGFAIMPASVRLPSGRLLAAVRCRGGIGQGVPGTGSVAPSWIDLYVSDDEGATWHYLNRPVPNTGRGGNPPSLVLLPDGRLCLVYGYRDAPFGIRYRLSHDGGTTWSEAIPLREDGGCQDLGYPRTALRPDGKLVSVYYFNDSPDTERYIAATIWQP